MPKRDKELPISRCPHCGVQVDDQWVVCPSCHLPLRPSLRRPLPLQNPPITTQQSVSRQAEEEDAEVELRRLNKGAAKAQIATAVFLALTFVAACIAGRVAYLDYSATRGEYEARARPYPAIHSLEFTRASENTTYLLIRMTNLGDRPATNVGIDNISLCAIAPIQCTIIPSVAENQENTILYPGRLRTTRIEITEDDYQKIIKTEILEVVMTYDYGNKVCRYIARLRLQPDNTWDIEQEQEEHVTIND